MVDPGGEFSFFLQSFAKNIGRIARVRGEGSGRGRAVSGLCNGGLLYFGSGCSVGPAVGCGVFGAGSGFRPG